MPANGMPDEIEDDEDEAGSAVNDGGAADGEDAADPPPENPDESATAAGGDKGGDVDSRFRALEAQTSAISSLLQQLVGGERRAAAATSDPQEEARLAAMDPIERALHDVNAQIKSLHAEMKQTQHQSHDLADHTAFHSLARSGNHPVHAKYADQVEAKLAELRKNGHAGMPRNLLLALLAGQDVISRAAAKGNGKQGGAAPQGQPPAKTRPPGRGDVIPGAARKPRDDDSLEAVEARLRAQYRSSGAVN